MIYRDERDFQSALESAALFRRISYGLSKDPPPDSECTVHIGAKVVVRDYSYYCQSAL